MVFFFMVVSALMVDFRSQRDRVDSPLRGYVWRIGRRSIQADSVSWAAEGGRLVTAFQLLVTLEERFARALADQHPVEVLPAHAQLHCVRTDSYELDSSFGLAFL